VVLEKEDSKNNINSLMVNETGITDVKLISSEMLKFYSELYSSKFSSEDCCTFLNDIAENIPKVDDFL